MEFFLQISGALMEVGGWGRGEERRRARGGVVEEVLEPSSFAVRCRRKLERQGLPSDRRREGSPEGRIRSCHISSRFVERKTPRLIKLQHLDFGNCTNLTMSRETLGNVTTLVYINISGCKKIEVLPLQVLHQPSLQTLYLFGTNLKEFSSAIGQLHDLEVLTVGPLLDETLPPSLCSLKSLKKLGLYQCKELKCFPASLGDLRNLKELRIGHCEKLECLLTSLGRLALLIELRVTDCPLIHELSLKEEVKGKRETWSELESSIDHCILPGLQKLNLIRTRISEVSFLEGVHLKNFSK